MIVTWARCVALSFMLFGLGGCVVANTIAEPWTRLRIQPSININPDISERPSPLVIRVYELSSGNAFQTSDFFTLYDDAEQSLGSDLLTVEDIVVQPGQVHEHLMSLTPGARYIGIMAAFRDIQRAQWRLLVKADPQGYDKINVEIDRLALKLSRD